jgi:hypothetical protein
MDFKGFYNKHWRYEHRASFYTTLLRVPIVIGLTPFMDTFVIPQLTYQRTQGAHSTQVADLPFGFGFQLLKEDPSSWTPSMKLSLQGSFPCAKYDHLHPNKLGTDGAGFGSWLPRICLIVGKIFSLSNNHFLSARFDMAYFIPNNVSIKGLSVYGGTPRTHGVIHLGSQFIGDLSFEYDLTRNWACALDIRYNHIGQAQFSGTSPLVRPGAPSQDVISLAPALEYNWNSSIGLIGGVWFSIFGRNAAAFTGGVLAFNWYI